MGDVVLTSPVVRCLKQQLSRATLHYLTKQVNYELLRANPYIDHIHLLDSDEQKMINQLKRERYDYIIDLQHNLRSMRFKRAIPGKSYSFNKLNIQKWLLVNTGINMIPNQHIVNRYLDTVSKLGVRNDQEGLDYFIPDDCQIEPANYHVELKNGFLAFAIGGQHGTKRLPPAKILEICQSLQKPVVLLGGKEDAKTALWVTQNCQTNLVYNACNQFTINESADWVRQADALITHDTALMHIGAALNKKIIAIWGNTIPEFGMYPYMPQNTHAYENFEIKGLKCRPCSKIGFDKCPKKHFRCMEEQDTKAIGERANATLI